ncbi:MAG: DegT/DnrJ/EryC1/StrS family aminotransferase [Sphingobacteriales bacterium]|nr:DegT/DnrJ/EryC1/StrS family aminotransferase [Sphingobacteriales bacterium]MBI3720838.1 DegT/DnrJ/EryC1/StrS family aminotransferase [Sphingobacteriales bacterium]
MNIRLFKPSLGEEELQSIKGSFDRSWVGLGEKVKQFETEWSKFVGCKSSVGLNSATAALQIAVQAFGFTPGKKIMVPSITFAATAFAPIYNGLEPVFVDVDEDTVSMSLEDMERKYTKDVVAIIPVHYAGHPAKIEEILAFAKAKNLKVIEDCAHTAGANYHGKILGTWGDIGCYSFEEKKCMTTGDGGMMCSDDAELMEYIKPARWLGINKEASMYYTQDMPDERKPAYHWHYEISLLGYKYNMNDLAASIGLEQLKKLPAMNKRRSEVIRTYMEGIKGLKQIGLLLPFEPEQYVYQMFGVRCEKRDDLILFLKSRGISTGVHYFPLQMHPYFKKWDNGCPVSEKIWTGFITLPLHSSLTNEEVNYIIEALQEADAKL